MDTTEHIEQLYHKAKNYSETSIELYKLEAIDTTADVVSSIAGKAILVLVLAIFSLFLNVGISLYLGKLVGDYYLGFLIVSSFYLILGVLLYAFNKKWVMNPISNLIIEKLMARSSKSPDQAIKKVEANEIIY